MTTRMSSDSTLLLEVRGHELQAKRLDDAYADAVYEDNRIFATTIDHVSRSAQEPQKAQTNDAPGRARRDELLDLGRGEPWSP